MHHKIVVAKKFFAFFHIKALPDIQMHPPFDQRNVGAPWIAPSSGF
jgi:hypothetical protein